MSDSIPRGRKGGRPQFFPTDQQRSMVTVLHAHGIRHELICEQIKWPDGRPVSLSVFERAFRRELDDAVERVKLNMVAALVKAAMGGNVGAIKYWLSTRGGPEWRITPALEDELPAAATVAISVDGGGAHGMPTVIIRGGLPQIPHAGPEMDGEAEEVDMPAMPVNQEGSGHAGNGADPNPSP